MIQYIVLFYHVYMINVKPSHTSYIAKYIAKYIITINNNIVVDIYR